MPVVSSPPKGMTYSKKRFLSHFFASLVCVIQNGHRRHLNLPELVENQQLPARLYRIKEYLNVMHADESKQSVRRSYVGTLKVIDSKRHLL